jgi:hypothetical protein
VVFLALTTADGRDLVIRVDVQTGGLAMMTDLSNETDSADGITSLVELEGTVYLARSRALGAPESGVYTLDAETERQSPVALLTDPGLDPVGIAFQQGLIFEAPGLFLVSSSGGQGDLRNALTVVTGFRETTPQLLVVARPCDGPDRLFDGCDAGLGDVAADIELNGGDAPPLRVMVSAARAAGPEGDLVAAYTFWDAPEVLEPGEVVFRESELRAQTGVSGVFPSTQAGVLAAFPFESRLYVASSGQKGSEPGIFSVVTPFEVAAERRPEAAVAVSMAPNPATGTATVRVSLAAPVADVRVSVLDARGREVASVASGARGAGEHAVALDTAVLAPGVYAVRVDAGGGVTHARLVVAR